MTSRTTTVTRLCGLASVVISLVYLSIHLQGCTLQCNTIGCNAGLDLDITMEDELHLPYGEYDVYFQINEQLVQEHCLVIEGKEASCQTETGAVGIDTFLFNVNHNGFSLFVSVQNETVDAIGGPEYISVQVDFEGETLGIAEYLPDYDIDLTYFGDEECGACIHQLSEEMTLTRPT